MANLDDIIKGIQSYYPDANTQEIRKAYSFAEEAHKGQLRRSGEPYLQHPLEVAAILAELHLDIPTIVTAFLHDTVEDTGISLEEIKEKFGPEVAVLAYGVTKLGKIRFRTSEEKQAENFRKMLLAMAKD